MSENQNRGFQDFSKYDAMETKELEAILRLDAENPEGQESDTEKILYIAEVLASRVEAKNTGKTALEAWKSFEKNYLPVEEDNVDHTVKTKRAVRPWVRRLAAAAAVLAILIAGSATANAFGFNIWKAVVQWTQETFHFGNWGDSDPNNNLQFTSFQEALEEGNVPISLVPTRIPEGYELVDITAERSPMKKTYKAKYTFEEKLLVITVRDYLDGDPVFVEQSEGLTEEYKSSGTIYYIFPDVDLMKVKWISGSYECSISGNVTIEELKMMIDSIEKG